MCLAGEQHGATPSHPVCYLLLFHDLLLSWCAGTAHPARYIKDAYLSSSSLHLPKPWNFLL